MPKTSVLFYCDLDGRSPVVEWLSDLNRLDRAAYAKCVTRIDRLREAGHELRRPVADILRSGIHELCVRRGSVNYRLLYFFHGQNVAILAHAIAKEDSVPESDIHRAIHRRDAFLTDPEGHTFKERR